MARKTKQGLRHFYGDFCTDTEIEQLKEIASKQVPKTTATGIMRMLLLNFLKKNKR